MYKWKLQKSKTHQLKISGSEKKRMQGHATKRTFARPRGGLAGPDLWDQIFSSHVNFYSPTSFVCHVIVLPVCLALIRYHTSFDMKSNVSLFSPKCGKLQYHQAIPLRSFPRIWSERTGSAMLPSRLGSFRLVAYTCIICVRTLWAGIRQFFWD